MMSYVTIAFIITLVVNCHQAEIIDKTCEWHYPCAASGLSQTVLCCCKNKPVMYALECGTTFVPNRIVNGWKVRPHQYPWTVPILKNGKISCGGSIINNMYILTAGHCVRWNEKENLTVVTGAHDLRKILEENTYTIDEVILHPEFYSLQNHDIYDITLLKLDRPIKFSSTILPVCLHDEENVIDEKMASVAGWGMVINDPQSIRPKILRETLVKVLSNSECKGIRKMENVVDPTIICAYNSKTDSCRGDSGGPLIHEKEPGKFEQIGVVSWGYGCAEETPGVYTRVSKFLCWIYENTEDATYCKP